ncbi:MAG: hypothetical protein R3E44_07440 [Paracoccaceae bacterium]
MTAGEGTLIASITPSVARRAFGVGVLLTLGSLLVLLAVLRPPASFVSQVFLVALGILVLLLCARLLASTSRGLRLTDEGVFDTEGRVVARLGNIARVERGVFAFKPSNGFVLHLKERQPRAWEPGLWWRSGRKVGVGGVISGAEGRQMADLIGTMLVRDSGDGAPPA